MRLARFSPPSRCTSTSFQFSSPRCINCASSKCGFARGGDPAAAYDSLARAIAAEPEPAVVDGESRTLGPGELDIAVASALYAGADGYDDLAAALAQAGRGAGDRLLALADAYTGRKPGGNYSNETAALYAIGCLDAPAPATQSEWYGSQILLADSGVLGLAIATKQADVALAWVGTGAVVHASHDHYGRAATSVALRLGLPILGMSVGEVDWIRQISQPPTSLNKPLSEDGSEFGDILEDEHIVRPEEWPVMPVERTGFALVPTGFFDANPALDLPPPHGA